MVIIQFIYAGMALFSKSAISEGMKPSIFVAYRQAFATLALTPFAFLCESKKCSPPSFKIILKMFLISLFGITLSLNLYYQGMSYTSATFASAITNTIPAIVFIMAICLRLERISIREWHGLAKVLGSAVGLSGAMVYTFYKGPPLFFGSRNQISHSSGKVYTKEEWIKGSIFMLGANLTWSMWLVLQAPILRQYPSKLRFTTLQCCFSCIASMIYGVAVERDISSWKMKFDSNLFSVAYCGIVVTGLTYWLQVWVVEKKGPVFTSIFSPLALILTAIFSALLFKETLHWGSVVAAVLLVAGLYSFLWGKNTEARSIANARRLMDESIETQEAKKTENEDKPKDVTKEEVSLDFIICTSDTKEEGTKVVDSK